VSIYSGHGERSHEWWGPGVQGFLLSAYSRIALQQPQAYITQLKTLVARELYHVTVTMELDLNSVALRLEGNIRNGTGWGIVKDGGRWGRRPLSVESLWNVLTVTYNKVTSRFL
jgi:hypothetical protein